MTYLGVDAGVVLTLGDAGGVLSWGICVGSGGELDNDVGAVEPAHSSTSVIQNHNLALLPPNHYQLTNLIDKTLNYLLFLYAF